MGKKSSRVIEITPGNAKSPNTIKVEVSDEAISYIVGKYVSKKSIDGVPVVIGMSTEDVETVIGLLVEWAISNGKVKDGIIFIGETPVR